jgi:hypothetical protein
MGVLEDFEDARLEHLEELANSLAQDFMEDKYLKTTLRDQYADQQAVTDDLIVRAEQLRLACLVLIRGNSALTQQADDLGLLTPIRTQSDRV